MGYSRFDTFGLIRYHVMGGVYLFLVGYHNDFERRSHIMVSKTRWTPHPKLGAGCSPPQLVVVFLCTLACVHNTELSICNANTLYSCVRFSKQHWGHPCAISTWMERLTYTNQSEFQYKLQWRLGYLIECTQHRCHCLPELRLQAYTSVLYVQPLWGFGS